MSLLFDLEMQCPSHDYKNQEEVPKIPSSCYRIGQWYHSDCGGKSQVFDDLTLRCSKCQRKNSIKNWKFFCTKTNQYEYITSLSFSYAISSFTGASL